MCVCVCVCVCVSVCVCMCVDLSIYVSIYVSMYVCVYLSREKEREREREREREWLIYCKELALEIVGLQGRPTVWRPRKELLLQLEYKGHMKAKLPLPWGTSVFSFLKVFNWLHEGHLHCGLLLLLNYYWCKYWSHWKQTYSVTFGLMFAQISWPSLVDTSN